MMVAARSFLVRGRSRSGGLQAMGRGVAGVVQRFYAGETMGRRRLGLRGAV